VDGYLKVRLSPELVVENRAHIAMSAKHPTNCCYIASCNGHRICRHQCHPGGQSCFATKRFRSDSNPIRAATYIIGNESQVRWKE